MTPGDDHEWLKDLVRDVPDFPKPGVVFKDITPLLKEPRALAYSIDQMAERFLELNVRKVLGIEARGFIVAAPLAYRLGAGLVPVRKSGKLPWRVAGEEYQLEYGTDRLEVHQDAIEPGEEILIIDDVLATGGTAAATARLAESCGGRVGGIGVVIELRFLGGRSRLDDYDVFTLITY